MSCQRQQPVDCCKEYRVCNVYNMYQEVVCVYNLLTPSQLSQIKFMTLTSQNACKIRPIYQYWIRVGNAVSRSSTGAYAVPVYQLLETPVLVYLRRFLQEFSTGNKTNFAAVFFSTSKGHKFDLRELRRGQKVVNTHHFLVHVVNITNSVFFTTINRLLSLTTHILCYISTGTSV